MTDDAHNEQTLWYTRRIVELERYLEESREREQRTEGEARRAHGLANDLAEVLRAVARGKPPEQYVAASDPPTYEERELPLERWRETQPFMRRVQTRTITQPNTDVEWP